jgi:hypothetical protein
MAAKASKVVAGTSTYPIWTHAFLVFPAVLETLSLIQQLEHC